MRLALPRLKPWQWILLAVGAAALAALALWVLQQTGALAALRQLPVREWIEMLGALGPLPYFAALAILPALGFPVMPFYLFAEHLFGRTVAIVGCLGGVTVNLAFAYVLGRWLLHPLIEKLMVRFGRRIPVVPPEHRVLVTLLIRITPGPPFFVQHYLLALAGVPFGIYMLVSIVITWTFAIGFIVLGEGLMSGRGSQLVLGLAFVVALTVVIRIVRKRLQQRLPDVAATTTTTTAHGDAVERVTPP